MEPVRKIVHPRIVGPVDLQLILNSAVNYKVKLQLIQKIFEYIEECCRTQTYFDNMIFVLLKLLSMTEPSFIADHDVFKIRKLVLQIIHKVCSSNDKIKSHIQNTMRACLKVIETDNEQCVIYCILIFKELLTTFKPKYDGCFKTEISKFLKLIIDMYNNSNTPEQILSFQKTSDIKTLISKIRVTTTITRNSVNYNFTPMGKVSFKVIKELGHMLKLYYVLFYGVQSFKNEIKEFLPILMNFFNLDIPYKSEYRDIVLDLKHAQVRLLFFFSIFLKDNKDEINLHFSTLPGRVIALLNGNMSSDVSNLRTELLSGFESLILIDYKYEFLPYMDKFLDESLITGRSWSLKNILRPKAYVYIDHLITHLHNQLSLNFLVRVIHLHFSNILDSTLQPEVQINLCNMVMNVLSYIVHRQNQLITNINTIEHNKNPLTDLFYRIFHIFVIKLKQFQKFYLPQLDECSMAKENIQESISSILAETQSKEKQKEFVYGYHSSQITPYTISDCRRFIKIIIPAIRTLFQFIVKIEGGKFAIEHHYKKLFKDFLKHSLLSLKIFDSSIKKKEMVKEVLSTLSCINSINLKTIISGDFIVHQIYSNSLETFFFDMTLNDEVLAATFSCLIFEFILKHLSDEKERHHVLDLIDKLQSNFELNKNEERAYEYIFKVIKMLMNILPNTKYPVFYIGVLKSTLMIIESAEYEFGDDMNSLLNCLFCDLLSYYHSLPSSLVVTKNELAELCLSECIFKVAFHPQLIDLLPVIAYSLQVTELTPQGLGILEKCLDILPDNFFDNPVLQVRNDIIRGLHHCLDSPFQSISQPAVILLGKFGGLNRSSIIKSYDLTPKENCLQKSKKPKIMISFENYNELLEIDFGPGVNTAVETLISNDDNFNRNQSWNILKGFFTVSMDYDAEGFINEFKHINWETCVSMFLNSESQYTKTVIDETYVKALTGLLICCSDDDLKADALKYFSEFTKQIIYISICQFSGLPCNYALDVNPFVLIDAIIIVLSNEKETISNFGIIAAESLLNELSTIFGDNMVFFPYINYMFRECCKICYDTSWICKRAGCTGLQVLFHSLITEETMAIKHFHWFNKHFLIAFRALLFTFSDPQGHLTFGVLEVAKINLNTILNGFYWTQQTNTSHNLIQETILKELIDNIVGPNDLLREQSIEIINFMAKKQGKTVLDTLEPFYEYFKSAIPGNRLFHTYTFKSQIGIMKGHIFCALHSIPLKQFDHDKSNKVLRYYYYILSVICGGNNENINKIKMFQCLTTNQLYEFHLTALQALGNSFNCLMDHEKVKVYSILLNSLKSPDFKIQEISYHCLKPHCDNTALIEMVDKLLFSYVDSIEDHDKITILSIRHVLYLSKLFPSRPNSLFCSKLVSAFEFVWNDLNHCSNDALKNELELVLENILEIVSLITETQFCNVKDLCVIILVEDNSKIDLCHRLYPWLFECVLKYSTEFLELFFQEQNIKKSVWSSFFNSMIYYEKSESLRKKITLDGSHLENLLLAAKIDPSRSIQYETIRIIYNLMKVDKKFVSSRKVVGLLLNIWSNPQYKERFKNLAAIKSTEWDEPKMLLKIILVFYRENTDDVFLLFQLLPVFSFRFPVDINFFRRYLENEIVNFSIKWKRMVFFKFVDVYIKKSLSSEVIGKILQYVVLPCFAKSYKNGEKEQLLCSFTKSDENIVGVILNKIFNNIRIVLTGCDFDGIKVFLCQLICMSIEDLINFNENISTLIYNAIIPCTSPRCTMDLNVKCHCYLILTFMMLSGNVPKDEKLKEAIYNELLKASFAEAQPVIDYSLNLIIMTLCKNNEEINSLVECIKKMMKNEFQSVPTLHRICSFVIRYNTLFYPYKQDLIRNLLGSLFPIAKNNNIPEFKKTAIELACMIIKWELTDENMQIKLPTKRKIDEVEIIEDNHYPSLPKKKSSEIIDNSLNFLAMVGCQTHDDKKESRISKLAVCSATLFKNILTTEPIDTLEVKLKFGWIEKLLDTFLKKENIVKQNPNAHGNTNASVMNLLTTFDILSFTLNVLSQKLMLEAIKPLQDLLIRFLQLAYNEEITFSYPQNQKDLLLNNQLAVSQYNEGTLNVITEILKTFSSNEGLEKLHLYIQMIISEGLSSNNPQQLEISLILLKGSLIHFAHYMDSEILNTIGDIMFKFNENNDNPLIKVKCLEVLKIHIDTLPRSKKQLFIEKVVMENLDKAKYVENSIPFEVQKKCFELIIIYIKDLSQATEGILLNSILLEYIKTTTDERIMEIILDVIAKWIEICKNEAMLFNSQTINILKSTIIINRFPKLTEYCYKLNLEIFKNWNSSECIEYGINCKYPSIRYDFIHFYDTLWPTSGVCMRLYSIMNNDLSYEVEYSIAFYIQFLFVKISKHTNIQGNFQLLKLKGLNDLEICPPTQSILTFDVCSSLAQLCFVDMNLAKQSWISIIPSVWSIFSNHQRTLLSSRAVKFLTNSKLKNNFLTTLYEAIILCEPKINFEPHQMVYIGTTYNLWYTVIGQLENIYKYSEDDKKDKAIEGMIQIYSLLREEDVLEYLFQNTIKCIDTKKALSSEYLGCFKYATNMYIELYNHDLNIKTADECNFYNTESEFRKIHLTKCLRELNEWNYLSENILDENDFLLNIENTWKNSIENFSSHDLKFYLEHKQKIWPTKLIWKYHFYLGMLGLNTLDEHNMSTVQENVELSVKDIINKWKVLPKYLCNAHIPLLQATQLIVEVQEAYIIQKSWLQTPQNISNIDALVELWNRRKPWIGDNLNVWNDLMSWRQTYYSFLNQDDLILKMDTIKSLQDQSKLLFGEIAVKQNMSDVCIKTLKTINPNSASTLHWLYKMFLEAKCVQKVKNCNELFDEIASSPVNKSFNDNMTPLLLTIRGSFLGYCGNNNLAFKCFTLAFLKANKSLQPQIFNWKRIIKENFKYYCSGNKEISPNNFMTNLNSHEILENAWIQWGTLIQNYFTQSGNKDMSLGIPALECYIIATTFASNIKCNILTARILWLLTYDDDNCTLLNSFKRSRHIIFSDFWIEQMLNIFVEKNKSAIQQIFSKIGKMHPQKMYLTLNRMYLAEKMNTTIDMETSDNIMKDDDYSFFGTQMKKIDKIKLMMHLVKKYNLHILQLDYFVDQIISLGENWVEELRRNLYECLHMNYDIAFQNKCLYVPVSSEILNFIENKIILFITEDVDTDNLRIKTTFLFPDDVSTHYQFFKEKCLLDFSFESIPTIKYIVCLLKYWIDYVETKFNYTPKFVHDYRCSKIHNIDWSVIKLPSDHFIDDSSKAVKIHNFSGNIYLKDKCGTIIKQLTIRGTDGLLYTYNISGGKGIESEERIFQLFHITNSYLLDFKETTKRFLKLSIPKTFTISPNLRMVEANDSSISLYEIYKEMINCNWNHEDIDFWFEAFNASIMLKRPNPLMKSFLATYDNYGSGKVLENWVSLRYPSPSDYWTFRKTFIEHYSLICFFEYAYKLIKLNPEMLSIDKNTGAAVVLHYTFFVDKTNENLARTSFTPFRFTPNFTNFITPFRKYQMINCLTATGLCLNNCIDEISIVLKLLLKDELTANFAIKNDEDVLLNKNQILKSVEINLNSILNNFNTLGNIPAHNPIPDLLNKAFHLELICFESPTWRPWL